MPSPRSPTTTDRSTRINVLRACKAQLVVLLAWAGQKEVRRR